MPCHSNFIYPRSTCCQPSCQLCCMEPIEECCSRDPTSVLETIDTEECLTFTSRREIPYMICRVCENNGETEYFTTSIVDPCAYQVAPDVVSVNKKNRFTFEPSPGAGKKNNPWPFAKPCAPNIDWNSIAASGPGGTIMCKGGNTRLPVSTGVYKFSKRNGKFTKQEGGQGQNQGKSKSKGKNKSKFRSEEASSGNNSGSN